MFQKNSIMSLKKKSKSLGHLTALGSPNFGSPKMKKQVLQQANNHHGGQSVSSSVRRLLNGGNHHYLPTRSTTTLNFNTQQQQQQDQQQFYSEEVYGKAYQLQQHHSGNNSKGIKTTTPKVRRNWISKLEHPPAKISTTHLSHMTRVWAVLFATTVLAVGMWETVVRGRRRRGREIIAG